MPLAKKKKENSGNLLADLSGICRLLSISNKMSPVGWLSCASLRLDSCLALYSSSCFACAGKMRRGEKSSFRLVKRVIWTPLFLYLHKTWWCPPNEKNLSFLHTYPLLPRLLFLVTSLLFFTQCVKMFPPFQEWLASFQLLCNLLLYFAANFELGVWQVLVVKCHTDYAKSLV